MPRLRLEPTEQQVPNSLVRRYSWVDGDVENGFLIKLVTNRYGEPIDGFLSALGHRFHRFGVTALIRDGKVVKIGYFLWLDDTQNHNMYQGIGFNLVQYSRAGCDAVPDKNAISDDNLTPYVERVASNAPENLLEIYTTTDTPDVFMYAAFQVHLTCVYSFAGCRNTRQILPEVDLRDFRGIETLKILFKMADRPHFEFATISAPAGTA